MAFDYGNNLRQVAFDEGVTNAFDYPGFVPAYVRPLFCEGKGPFRWAALSGDPKDIWVTDEVILKEFAYDEHLVKWIQMAHDKVAFQAVSYTHIRTNETVLDLVCRLPLEKKQYTPVQAR